MLVSYNWIKDYIDIDIEADKLSEILTTIGLEVEGVEEIESIKGGLKGLVIGKVITCGKHPDADKLSVTTVDVGGEEPIQVVCGAPNVAAEQTVVVATVGTTLCHADGEFKIKKSKIRGVVSQGMICAEDEIGLGTSHDGIIVIGEDVKPGTPANEFYELENDIVFEIGLTPNRSDATAHIGVAEDIAAYVRVHEGYTKSILYPEQKYESGNTTNPIKINVHDTYKCPRYAGVTLSNIKVGSSPEWIKNRLQAIGVSSINNVVDITNYVLHEFGQPLHAFDLKKVIGNEINVRTLAEGTPFVTLDGIERKLRAEDLVICDGENTPMCLAGVLGGEDSGVSESTTSIFLESAHFEAITTRVSSTKHILRTDAAKCFEKGSNPNIVITALERAVSLLQEYTGAILTSDIEDYYPNKIEKKQIEVSYRNVNRLIGVDISKEDVNKILAALNIEISKVNGDSILVEIPTNKADVTREVDVIEEILRIYGFNNVAFDNTLKSSLAVRPKPDEFAIDNKVGDFLASRGLCEMMATSITQSKYLIEAGGQKEEDLVFIQNTSNQHLDVMRSSMLFGALEAIVNNQNRQQSKVKLFEFGHEYTKEDNDYKESKKLGIALNGKRHSENWHLKSQDSSFYDIKSYAESVLSLLGINKFQTSPIEGDNELDYGIRFHQGKNELARFGKIKGSICKKMGVKTDVFYAVFDWEYVITAHSRSKTLYKSLSKYPFVRRDLALVIEKNVNFSQILSIANKYGKHILSSVNLFDVYESEEHLGKGKASYSISYTFQDGKKTLKDKEIDKIINTLIKEYETQLGAVIRK